MSHGRQHGCTIRSLGAGDAPVLRAMLDMFGRAFEDEAHYGSRQPDDAYLEALLAGDTFVAVAALSGGGRGEVVGGIAGYVLPKFEQARKELYLYDLAVAEAHRRRGIATALIGQLRLVAAQRGAYVIFVQADLGDDPAIALYDKLGTRAEVLHFDIEPAARGAG